MTKEYKDFIDRLADGNGYFYFEDLDFHSWMNSPSVSDKDKEDINKNYNKYEFETRDVNDERTVEMNKKSDTKDFNCIIIKELKNIKFDIFHCIKDVFYIDAIVSGQKDLIAGKIYTMKICNMCYLFQKMKVKICVNLILR